MHFWQKLKKEKNKIFVLAPMADVTDVAFRTVISTYGKPDVMWTEFVSADGLFLSPIGSYCEAFLKKEITRDALYEASETVAGGHLLKDLLYGEMERPIVAQLFTSKPELMEKASELAALLGFDGVDINMGCPDKSIEKQGAGAALIKTPLRAQELVYAAQRGTEKAREKMGKEIAIPVSVKTRVGYNKNELETWLPMLLETNPSLITVHARTRKEMSLVPARWSAVDGENDGKGSVAEAVKIRDEYKKTHPECDTLIFGNGDVLDIFDARKKAEESGADGVMLGRAIFGNPFLFSFQDNEKRNVPDEASENTLPTVSQRLLALVEHTKLFEALLPHKSFAIMKKHYKSYIAHALNGVGQTQEEKNQNGVTQKELRMKLMDAKDATEVESIIQDYLKKGLK